VACFSSRASIGGQWSPVFNGSTVAYAPPSVSFVSVIAVVNESYAGLMDTAGGDQLVITGELSSAAPPTHPQSLNVT